MAVFAEVMKNAREHAEEFKGVLQMSSLMAIKMGHQANKTGALQSALQSLG